MGTFRYGLGVVKLKVDDVTLRHLQYVMSSKLRRGESFMLSWDIPPEQGSGRASVWIDQSVQMHFQYDKDPNVRLDRHLVEEMSIEAMNSAGINLTDTTHATESSVL